MSTMTPADLDNPYWEAVREHIKPSFFALDEHSPGQVARPYLGPDYDADPTTLPDRQRLVSQYSWSITDPDSLAFVAKYSDGRLVDPIAGTGYWGSLLGQLGVDVVCYDIAPGDNLWHKSAPLHMLVQVMDGAAAVAQHADRTLLLAWPPYSEPVGDKILTAYPGQRVIFMGEDEGGCTGDENMFALLAKGWVPVARHTPVQWFGLHDEITVYDRRH